ncbi:energy transducer TonB [Leptobacterium flavescens]|uniref:Energy transducer TonB n=1 Tax=Leptobacterium flavescens TaxID=472055 RepID=A0A6P0UHE4_9FLAO|nr:energy transducer TonB [Leptobacterium flavescens]NER12664.1 energy transducer TonB [Leptobacterium flavescens]
MSLLTVYLALEAAFPYLNPEVALADEKVYVIDEDPVPDFTVYQEPEKVLEESKVEKKIPPVEAIDKFDVIDNEDKRVMETVLTNAEDLPPTDLDLDKLEVAGPEEEPVNILAVQFAPIFDGCEDVVTNSERIACMSERINRIVLKHFDTSLGSLYGLSGRQRIDVQFKIDKEGEVTDIKVRAPHPALEKEAKRVMERIPQMQPGRNNNRKVEVIFSKPIIFQIRN